MIRSAIQIVLFISLLIPTLLLANESLPIVLDEYTEPVDISADLLYLEDKEGRLKFDQVLRNTNWEQAPKKGLSAGFTDSVYWLRFVVQNTADKELSWNLEFTYSVLDEIQLYSPDASGGFTKRVSGDSMPFSTREINYRNVVFTMKAPANLEQVYYVRIKTTSSMKAHLKLWPDNTLYQEVDMVKMFLGIFYGAMMLAIISSLINAIVLREWMYTWLAAALFFGTLYLSGIKGAAFQYLWPNSVWWTTYSIPISILLASVPMIEFARLFTNIKTISYKLERFLYYFKALMVICIFTGMFMPYGVIIRICTVTTIILGFVCMMVGIGGWRNGDTSARLFVLAWTSFFLSSTAFAFNSLGLLPKAFIVEWAQEVGYLLFAILMTVAMFDRYLQVQTNQRRQQDSALKSLAYAEKKYRSLFENALEGLFEMNHEGGLKSTNAAFKRIVGLNEAQPGTDHSFTLGFLSESQALHFKSKLQDDGHINNYLVELQGDEAEYRWLSISAHKVSDKNDETYRFEGSIDDITETKKREQAESRVRRAEVEGETRSLILNNVSAEIKKPVTNIIKLTEDALVLQPNKVLHSKLDDVKGESLKLLLRINDILDFSAMEMGKLKLNNESFTLTDMQTQFQQMLSAFEKESLVNISLEVADDIPKSLLGDYQRITQVFASLLGQVLKQRGDLSRLTLTLGLRSLSRRSGNVKLRGSILVSDSAAGSLGNSEGVPKNLELNSDSTISQRLIDLMQGSISLNPRSDCLVEFNFVCRVDSRQSKKEESVVVLDSNPLLPQDVVEPVTDSQALESNVVDFDVGLSRCQGNERLYRQILSEFVEDYQDFSSKLQMQCDAGDLDALSNLAHTLKGVASNIGAGQLSGIALELEEGGDRNITILLGALDRELKASLSQIHDFLNIQSLEGSRDASDSSEGEKEKLGSDAVLEALQELSTLIRGKKVDAYDQAVLLSEQWPLEWGKEALANLVDLVDQFEFEQAEEALEPILEAAGKA